MIRDPLVARTYASAVFAECIRKKCLESIRDDLAAFCGLIRENSSFRRFIEGPQFLTEEKTALIEKVFGKKLNALSLSFILLLIRKHRIENLLDIQEEFHARVLEYQGRGEAEVISAVELTGDELEKLAERLEKRNGMKLIIRTRIVPEILGGISVRIGNDMIDNTLRRRLDELKMKLNEVKVH